MKRRVRPRSVPTNRTRPLWFEQVEQRLLLTTGVSTTSALETEPPGSAVPQVIEGTASAQFRLELNDLAGQPITSLREGEDFFVNAYVSDLRSEPQGVFSAYLDVYFDADRVVPAGGVEFGRQYTNALGSGGSVRGLLRDVGGFSGSLRPIGGGDFLLFRAPFRAEAAGPVSFMAEPANLVPHSLVLLYGDYEPLANHQIDFGSLSVDVLGQGDSSLDAALSPTAGFLIVPHSKSPESSNPPDPLLLAPSLPEFAPTARAGTSVLGIANPWPVNPSSADRQTHRDAPLTFHLLNLGLDLTEGLELGGGNRYPHPQSPNPEVSIELGAPRSATLSFSMRGVPDFSFDRRGARPTTDPMIERPVGAPVGWGTILHDRQWLTVGLVRIAWTPEVRLGKTADAGRDGEMFDLARIAYETIETTRMADCGDMRIDDEDDEWIAGLDRLFSEEVETAGSQGTMMALEVDRFAGNLPEREATRVPPSAEPNSADARTGVRPEENSDRRASDDGAPAA